MTAHHKNLSVAGVLVSLSILLGTTTTTLAEVGDGVSLSAGFVTTDHNRFEDGSEIRLEYEKWWDGGFSLTHTRLNDSIAIDNITTIAAGIFYQGAISPNVLVKGEVAAVSALSDTSLYEKSDVAPRYTLSTQWRVTDSLGVEARMSSFNGLGEMKNFSTFYLGLSYWPMINHTLPIAFKKYRQPQRTMDIDWDAIAKNQQEPAGENPAKDQKASTQKVVEKLVNLDTLPTPEAGYFYVQLGSFSNVENAKHLITKAEYSGYDIYAEPVTSKNMVRVLAGKFSRETVAQNAQKLLGRSVKSGSLIVSR